MKFDENLRNLRKEKSFSQEYLAEIMNVSRQTISKWENGTAMPDLKRITELAKLFDTSVDELLGTSAPSYNNASQDNGSAELEAVKESFNRYSLKIRKILILLFVLVITLTIALMITNVMMLNFVSNLQTRINNIPTPNSQVIYSDEDNSLLYDLDYYVSNIDRENPNMCEMTFEYTPKSYVKGSTVSLVITDMASSAYPKTVEAKLSGNSYIATARLNFSSVNMIDISVDDGTNVTTERVDIDWIAEYHAFTDLVAEYGQEIEGSKTRINFDAYDARKIAWQSRSELPQITEAYVEAEDEKGKIVYSNKLKPVTDENETTVSLKSFTVNGDVSSVYVRLVDELGSVYKIKCINIFKDYPDGGEIIPEVQIELKDGVVLTTD